MGETGETGETGEKGDTGMTVQAQTHWMMLSMPCFTDLPVRTKVSLNPNIAYHLLGLLQG